MSDESKKTWIKQGNIDATFPEPSGLVLPIKSHSYCTTTNLIDDSGLFAIVQTKNGQPWDGVSNRNIKSVYVYTTKDTGKMTRDLWWSDGHESQETRLLDSYDGTLALNRDDPTIVTIDIPCFKNLEEAENYIKTGDWSNALNSEALQIANTITRVYVDKSQPPNLKLVFDVDEPEDSEKNPPNLIYVRMWKCKDYGDLVGASQFLDTTFQFGGSQSYTWASLEFEAGGNLKDIAIETSTHADWSQNGVAYVGDNGSCMPQTKETNGKNSIICIIGSGEGDDGYQKPEDTSDGKDENTVTNTTGLLTTTYLVSSTQLQSLGNFLWQDDFMSNIKLLNNSPIENIVSVKAIPVTYPTKDSENIVLGNVDSGVNATPVTTNYLKTTVGSIKVPHLRGFFADYEQAKVTIYLPLLCTFVDLDPKEVIGFTVTLKYVFDCITGDILALIYNNRGGAENIMGTYKGNCGIDIPLTASNRAQVEAGYISDFISGVTSIASKNPVGMLNAGMSAITRENTSKSSGSVSGVTSQGAPNTAYLTISNANCQSYSNTFLHTYGRPCMLKYKLSKLNGYTLCDSNVDLSGISCTNTEREMLRNILSSGFYL